MFDVWGWRQLARPFEIVGINAIFVFVASGLTATLLGRLNVGGTSAHEWLYENLFTSWITDSKLASVSFAAAYVAFWWLVCAIMARVGWTLRV
jgi:predicted acyltransferase